MKLYLQMGHGMMSPAEELLGKWQTGTVILSPRDLEHQQMEKFSAKVTELGGEVLCDPQFYLPRADHEKLTNHTYWPSDYTTAGFIDGRLNEMLQKLWEDYCLKLNTSAFILPGCYASDIDEDWLDYHDKIIDASTGFTGKPKYATLCLSTDVLRSEEKIHTLLSHIEQWDVDGFYIVPEHSGVYYVDDPLWMVNLMDLCSGLKLLSKFVLVGYSTHQNLILSLAGTDAIASGTFVNVRKLPLSKFNEIVDDSPSRRKPWYYSPQALSEFQLSFLDMGQRGGILDLLKVDPIFSSEYADILFTGAKPTDTAFKEGKAFRHYLQCLKVQVEQSHRDTYKETLNALNVQLNTAERVLRECHSKGVLGKYRDFSDIIDVNRSAITVFDGIRGFVLDRAWDSII